MNEWINLNMLSLYFDDMCCMHILAKQNFTNKLNIAYENTILLESNEVKFLSINLDNISSW